MQKPREYYDCNISGLLSLVEVMRDNGCKNIVIVFNVIYLIVGLYDLNSNNGNKRSNWLEYKITEKNVILLIRLLILFISESKNIFQFSL